MVRAMVHALGCVLVASTAARPQACDGLSADRGSRIGYLLSAEASRDLQAYTARVGGAGNALFGGASLGVIRYNDVDGFGFQLGADLGHAFSMDAGGRAFVCPIIGAAYTSLPSAAVGAYSNGPSLLTAGAKLGAGIVLGESWEGRVVPFGSIELVRDLNLNAGSDAVLRPGVPPASVNGRSESRTLLGLGIGFARGDNVVIRPMVRIPVGADGPSEATTFSLAISFLLGAGRESDP